MNVMTKVEPVESEFMTAQEVADYLRLDVATIYKLAQAGDIPAAKIGRTWRFRRDLIDEWFKEEATSSSGLQGEQ